MDVVVHIGAHRCGSTTLQQFLQRNEAPLARAGVESWTPDRTRSGLFAGLIQRPDDLPAHAEQRAKRSSGIIRIEVDRLVRTGCRTLIISEENLIGAVRDNLREGELYPTVSGRMQRLRPALGGHITQVALSIRSYDSYWASCVAYGVAQGHRVPSMAKLERLVHQPRRWRHLVTEISQAFPGVDIVVWPFERFCGQPETQLSILSKGVQVREPFSGLRDWHNPSPRLGKLRRILSLRGDADMAARLPPGEGRWTPFDAGQRDILRRAYHEDLAWFDAGAGGVARMIQSVHSKEHETQPLRHHMPEQQYEFSGFAVQSQAWVPPEGGQVSGQQRAVV